MSDAPRCWRDAGDGVAVAVKVTPRARRPGVGGIVADAGGARLAISVREVPEEGRANRAACAALARALDLPLSAVSVTAGASARRKTLQVRGDPRHLAAKLAAL